MDDLTERRSVNLRDYVRTPEEIERDIAGAREWAKRYKNPDPTLREGLEWTARKRGITYDEHVAYLMRQAMAKYGDNFYDD